MPLIRYSIGDIGVKAVNKSCGCGRGFDLMGSIQGRSTDVVITPAGNRLIVHFFTGIMEHFPEISSFQVRQEEKESIVIYIVPKTDISKEVEERIINQLKQKGATDLKIMIEYVDDIPLQTTGKRKFVISSITT